jgi:hypothetical protein
LTSVFVLLAGVSLDRGLAAHGITWQNALEGRQAVACTVYGGAAVAVLGFYSKPDWLQLPAVVLLYGEAVLVGVKRESN